MGRVLRFDEARIRRMVDDISAALVSVGQAIAKVQTDRIDPDLWRLAARRAARQAGLHVRTGLSRDGSTLWAVDMDREVTEADMRRAALATDRTLSDPLTLPNPEHPSTT